MLELTALGALARAADCLLLLRWPRLFWTYLRSLFVHLRVSPYRWPRGFEATRIRQAAAVEERELVYGETPVFTAWWLLRRTGLSRGERFVDLCAGRGRPLLAARTFTDQVEGWELLPERAQPVRRALAAAGIRLQLGDGTQRQLQSAQVAMVTWTGFGESLKARFEATLRTLPPGGRLIAVDRPFDGPGFQELSRHEVLCTWGLVPVWIYRRLDSDSDSG